jgi:hypothetical protein
MLGQGPRGLADALACVLAQAEQLLERREVRPGGKSPQRCASLLGQLRHADAH